MNITLAGGAATYAPDDDELGRVSLEFAAFDGEIGTGQLPVPDPTAALAIETGRQARVDELGVLLTNGFIIDNDRLRGPVPAGAASPSPTAELTYSVMDANALLGGFRVLRNRNAETDYVRVIAFAAADGPTWDTTWVLNASTITMPKKKYESDGGWGELITDLVEFTGKTLFLHDKALGGRCLHYHLVTNGHTCGLSISDVPGASNESTIFKPSQPLRQRTSIDLANNVKGRDQANRVKIYTDSTSITAHDADGLKHEVLVDFEAQSQADLNAKTLAFLGSQRYDLDTYTCAIGPLDATALSKIRVGDLITVTSSVMGLTASPQRIAHMTLQPWTGLDGPPAPELWTALLELGNPIRRRARIKPGPAQGRRIVPPPPYDPTQPCTDVVLTGAWTKDSDPDFTSTISGTSGSFIVVNEGFGSSVATWHKAVSPGVRPWDIHAFFTVPVPNPGAGSGSHAFLYVNGAPGLQEGYVGGLIGNDGTTEAAWAIDGVSSGTVFGTIASGTYTFDLNIRTSDAGIMEGRVIIGSNDTGWMTIPGLGSALSIIYVKVETGTTPEDYGYTITLDDIRISEATGGCLPAVGQDVVPETVATGDGATTLYTTDFPYQPGTLRVFVNGLRELNVSQTSPDDGTFTFASPPFLGEVITVEYVAMGGGA